MLDLKKPEECAKTLQEAFVLFDADGSGALDAKEGKKLLHYVNPKVGAWQSPAKIATPTPSTDATRLVLTTSLAAFAQLPREAVARAIRDADRLGSGIVEDDFQNMIVKWAVPLEGSPVKVCSTSPPPAPTAAGRDAFSLKLTIHPSCPRLRRARRQTKSASPLHRLLLSPLQRVRACRPRPSSSKVPRTGE